jgi:hypothetical protein
VTIITPTFTPTPDVTATLETPAVANPCYNLLYLEDRTIPDGTQMKPNEVFTKTWYVQNSGGCAWAPGFTFAHFGGDPMEGEPLVLTEPIPAGAKRELSIELSSWRENGLIQVHMHDRRKWPSLVIHSVNMWLVPYPLPP